MRAGLRTVKVFAVLTLLSTTFHVEGSAPRVRGADPSRVFYGRLFFDHPNQKSTTATARQSRPNSSSLLSPVRFRESRGRGLLLKVWVNDSGPYNFALDTGAGANILSRRVASEARVEVETSGQDIHVGGLSGVGTVTAKRAYVRGFAAGTRSNQLPARGFTVIANGLPADIDGVLDPTEAFWPLGFTIDIPGETLSAFDPRLTPLRSSSTMPDEVIVPWLTEQGSRRPFVMLAEGRRALIDTGSGFGLAVNVEAARNLGINAGVGSNRAETQDIAGGRIPSKRISPATVHIGSLSLRNVPTDYLPSTRAGAPVLLGRDALRPFQLTFDPVNRLIRLKAS